MALSLFGTARQFLTYGNSILIMVQEVQTIKRYADPLADKIRLLTPHLQILADMEGQEDGEQDLEEVESSALSQQVKEILSCVDDMKDFISSVEELNNMRFMRRYWACDAVRSKAEKLTRRLDELQKAIMFGVLVDVKRKFEGSGSGSSRNVQTKEKNPSPATANVGEASLANEGEIVPRISLDDVEFGEVLGKGGFGTVYLAKYRHAEHVAVKIFDTGDSREILKETSKMRHALFSQYIVRLLGIIDDSSQSIHGIVMDYFQNGNLKSFLPYLECNCWARRMRMLCDIAVGINHLHSLEPPIVHMDIKLSNIFVDHGFMAKLGDLGLSSSGTSPSHSQSKAKIAGTRSHIPPEVWVWPEQEPKNPMDIYEYGISIFEFVSGENPWPSYEHAQVLRRRLIEGKRPDIQVVKTDTPIEIVEMMQRCWQTDPNERPTSQEIMRYFTNIYERNYANALGEADRNIRIRMDLLIKDGRASSADSGMDTLQESVERMTVNTQSSEKHETSRMPDSVSTSRSAHHPHRSRGTDWHLVKEFKRDMWQEFKEAKGISVCQNGNIVVTDWLDVYIFDCNGNYKSKLESTGYDHKTKLEEPQDVAVTSRGDIVVVDGSQYVKMFCDTGAYRRSFCTVADNEDPYTEVSTLAVAVSCSGVILIGDKYRRLITVHNETTGDIISKFKIGSAMGNLAVTSYDTILVGDFGGSEVVAMDFSGKTLFKILSKLPDGLPAHPSGVATDINSNIYVAIATDSMDAGHIHMYNTNGEYLRCIAKDLYNPWALTWADGLLYVANFRSVLIYSSK